jgi:hypothetical protein
MSRWTVRFLLLLALLGTGVGEVNATHFRYGNFVWRQADGPGFSIQATFFNAWRRDGYVCYSPATLEVVPCLPGDGYPRPTDVILETIGGTLIDWGDGSQDTGSPLGPLMYVVTSVSPQNNWWFGNAMNPNALPGIFPLHNHVYLEPGDYLASIDSCCRISQFDEGNYHVNNPDGDYRVEMLVNAGSTNNSPIAVLPPIIPCPRDGQCAFIIPALDPDGDPVRFRMSTPVEAGGNFVQPGPPHAPLTAGVNPFSGLYTWNTTGATVAPSPVLNTLYSTQVTITDSESKIALDFFIQLVEPDDTPPAFDSAVCGTTREIGLGQTDSFEVTASDPNPDETVVLNVAGLPVGATMTPGLPAAGNPVSSVFEWQPTPSQAGPQIVAFNITSSGGGFDLCPVFFDVLPVTTVGIDIRPGSDDNPVNPASDGVIPVALLGSADFDVADVDTTTLAFGPHGAAPLDPSGSLEDVDGDGVMDLVSHYPTQETGIAEGDTEACVSGATLEGAMFEGCDSVTIVPPQFDLAVASGW